MLSFRALWLLLAVGALLGAGFCLRQSLPRLRQAADITTPDSVMVQTAIWARQSGAIYHSASRPPFTPAVYGPLYYLILIGLSYGTGVGFAALAFAGRLFTLGCFLAVAAVLWLWARRLGLPRWLALLAPLFLLSQIAFLRWDITTRPDLAALLASAAAVYVATALGHPAPRGLGPALLAGLLAGAAVMLKQSALAAPGAIALWLALRRLWPALAVFIGAAVAFGVALLGGLALQGERLADLGLLQHPYPGWATGLGVLLRQFTYYVPDALLLALALLGAAAAVRAARRSHGPLPAGWGLLVLYFVFAWAWGLLALCLNSGGGGNYLVAAWAATALLAAAGLAALRPVWTASPAAARSLILLWVAATSAAGLVTWHHRAVRKLADQAPLAALLRHDRVLTDVPYLGVHSRHPEYLDPYLLRTLELSHRWSSRRLARQITARRFDLVLLDIGGGRANTLYRGLTRFDRRTLAALRRAYAPYCLRDTVAVLLPAPPRPTPALAGALRAAGCRPVQSVVRFFPPQP
ncbi:MAG: hypothetical protein ACRD2E_07595 [Terriglobales bacterium]